MVAFLGLSVTTPRLHCVLIRSSDPIGPSAALLAPSRRPLLQAFHVFKVFVANPNKSKAILDILLKNKSKLIDFLTKFHESRSDDEQFAEEKSYLIKQIKEL